ncbi:MAG: SGNH hydrolase domain-containing protein, partial [Actinomycetota bacterium]
AVAVMPRILDHDSTTVPNSTQLATTGFTPVPTNLDFAAIKGDTLPLADCLGEAAHACVRVSGGGLHLLVLGDSYAGMMIPALEPLAESNGLTLSAFVGCPWQRHLFTSLVASVQARCNRAIADAYDRVIPELDPDIVVVMNAPYEQQGLFASYLGPDGTALPKSSRELAEWVESTTEDSLAALRAGGRKVVIIEPTPTSGDNFDPLQCLSAADVVEECRYAVEPSPTGLEQLYRKLDASNVDVWAANLDELVCPFLPICDPIVDGQVVKFDGGHLVRSYAAGIAPSLASYLADNGVIP